MSELKFRAWDKTHKKMLDRVLAGPGDPCSIVWDDERKEWLNFDEFCGDIMQYTGLKDKNGREIYEGDVVLVEDYAIGTVQYGNAVFFIGFADGHGLALQETCQEWLSVQGNIYEQEGTEGK